LAEDNERESSGFLQNMRERVAGHAGALKESAAAAWREKTAEIREAFGPDKTAPVKEPDRPFGREDGGRDIKRVVWTGHTVEIPQGQRYFGAVGLADSGYYRAAEVRQYGSEEAWKWQGERHIAKEEAIKDAQRLSEDRLNEHDRLTARNAAHAARDALHDAGADFKPGAYTVWEARDRAAHTPSILDRDAPRNREEEARMIDALHKELFPTPEAVRAYELNASAGLKAPADPQERQQWNDFQAEASAQKPAKEKKADVTPEQQANVNKMLGQTSISREQIGGASEAPQAARPLDTPKMPEPPQGSPQQGRSLSLEK
jgi:hypothetical protein